jgi:excinuclease ABC subunit C
MQIMSLEDKIRQLPNSPGAYLMRDADGTIIYVGKARNLRQRVRSYFNVSGDSRYHVKFLVARVADIEVMLTDTEKEALLLENTLIKQHHPRYNLDLKDDKTYFSLRLDLRENFPRFTVVRKIPSDGARYFGPYASASDAREVLRQMTRMFPLRHYPLATCMARRRPCLYHQIGQCSAPCQGMISSDDYAALTRGAMMFLEGKGQQLVAEFKRRMSDAADGMRYEEAARWRNLLRSIQVTVEKQKVVLRGGDSDVVGFHREGNRIELAVMFIRGGVLTGSRLFCLGWELDDTTGISAFMQQYYTAGAIIPGEIFLPLEIEGSDALAELLGELKGGRVSITRPQRGTKRELVELACKNAESAVRERDEVAASTAAILAELQQRLRLSRLPGRIECYDISTIQGRFSVGSGVVFCDGRTDKRNYRRYRIKTVEGQDDFAMLREVFSRRFRDDSIRKNGLPDLVVVDGGIGQLNAAHEIIAKLGLAGRFDLVSLAKSRTGRAAESAIILKSTERIYLPGRKNPVLLRQNSAPLLLLAAIRDEAHRFAVDYHRNLRGREGIASGIDCIPGIGVKRRTALLTHFGSLQRMKEAGVEEFAGIPGMNRNVAEKLHERLHNA